MNIGISLGITGIRAVADPASFTVSLTGLTSGAAIIGDHASISYTTDPVSATETVKWSASSDPDAAATYGTGASPTDFTSADEFSLYLHVTDGGETVTVSAPVRYAAGTAPAIADGQTWTVDDTSVSIDASASGTGLTWGYVLTGSTAGVTINASTGLISGTPTGVDSGTATITATDQYGREVSDTFTYTASLRTQATGGADLDLSFVEDSAITSTDLTANWTENGNTLTYAITGTALPAGLSVSSAGAMTGTPTTVTADATYTLRGTDEYGRTTDDTFTLQITAAATASDISALSYTDSTSTVAITASTGDTPLTLYWIIDKKSTTPSGAQIEAGDSHDDAAATLGGSESISVGANSFTEDTSSVPSDTGYYFHAVIKNAGGYGTASTDGPFAVDNTAPTVSYSPADNATDVAVDAPLVMTFNEAMDTDATTTVTLKVAGGSTVETFDSATDGTWSVGDTVWTVSPASDFTDGAGLAVQYSGFKDASGNPVAAVANDTTWNFDVVTAASASTSVFTGENGSFSSSPSFSLPVLSAGTYLVFASVLQSGITISGGTLEGTTLGTEIEGLAASDYELACFEVTISGGGNQTLVVNLSGATSNTVVNVVKLASGSSTETQPDSLLGTPPDLDFTFSNTADGEIITFWVGSASSTFSSYDGMTALTAAVSNTEFKSGSALAAVSGGTPVTVGVNFASSFSRALGIAVKVV